MTTENNSLKRKADQHSLPTSGPSPPKKIKTTDDAEAGQKFHPFFHKHVKALRDESVESEAMKWHRKDTMIYSQYGDPIASTKIAAFDMDGTLIIPKGNRRHPTDQNDWKFYGPGQKIPKRMKELLEAGYQIVIFSNQAGFTQNEVGEKKMKAFQQKVGFVAIQMGVPFRIFVATGRDKYRKPCISMWQFMLDTFMSGLRLDLSASFFVGDAAGRQVNWQPRSRGDFSDSDRKFAMNIGLKFHTPEEFWLNSKQAKYELKGFCAKTFLSKDLTLSRFEPPASHRNEMILFVGYPASGKSSFARKYFESRDYVIVNQDTLKTRQKCIDAVSAAVSAGKGVVIDNTNPESSTRGVYISIAKKFNIPVRCLHFQVPLEMAKHLNVFRELTSNRPRLPDVAFTMFHSKFQLPSLEEGFDELINVHFTPEFENEDHERIWNMHLT